MARIRRNDAPADGDAFGLARSDGGDRRRRARFHGMLAPPRIGFGEPERVKAGSVASLRHTHCLVERLHAELQDADLEGHAHRCDFSPFVDRRLDARRLLNRIPPGMLQTFYELPQRAIEWRGHSKFLAAVRDGAIHEIDFSLTLGKDILQHSGFVIARSIGAFLDERARIAVKLNSEGLGDSFAL